MSEVAGITSTKILEPGEVELAAFGIGEFAGLRGGAKLSPAQLLAAFVDVEVATSLGGDGKPRIDRLGIALDSANVFGNYPFNAEVGVALLYGDPERGPTWLPDYVSAKSIVKVTYKRTTLKYGRIAIRNTATGEASTSYIATAVLPGLRFKTPYTANTQFLRPYFSLLIGENQHGQKVATFFWGLITKSPLAASLLVPPLKPLLVFVALRCWRVTLLQNWGMPYGH